MAQHDEEQWFTMCVFQDTDWAGRGLDALKEKGFGADSISVLSKQTVENDAFVKEKLGFNADHLDVRGMGTLVAVGPLVGALQGDDEGLGRTGIAATIRRVGFQAHDGFIYQTLTERGGVLVAVEGQPRAADALALFHSYGGGNAAIGAWNGRV